MRLFLSLGIIGRYFLRRAVRKGKPGFFFQGLYLVKQGIPFKVGHLFRQTVVIRVGRMVETIDHLPHFFYFDIIHSFYSRSMTPACTNALYMPSSSISVVIQSAALRASS